MENLEKILGFEVEVSWGSSGPAVRIESVCPADSRQILLDVDQ